ncbi:hypothetical protein EX30DRAFT_157154 [Ascodesmis nigricans]|uniref:Uncharacterized protein n=1 Tax=Ascodesmis nigricans TaxID=341454 RepID=A0A4S2MN38_9PEZI|nr:hypothetical protein EX30DRAFT_157154 [Ascodesmis nigricans]
MGVKARFIASVAVPLSKAYAVTIASNLVFRDAPASGPTTPSLMPDTSILYLDMGARSSLRAVDESKTPWKFLLENYSINHPLPQQYTPLEFRIDKLASQLYACLQIEIWILVYVHGDRFCEAYG